MTGSEAETLLLEALSSEWQPEDVLVRYVRTHARRPIDASVIRTALSLLGAQRKAEAHRFAGYPHSHWRRADARRRAA